MVGSMSSTCVSNHAKTCACELERVTTLQRVPARRVIGNKSMEQLITQFLDHLRYERNVSEHTLRNYASDLNQLLEYLAPAHPETGKRTPPDLHQVDHITIREWLSLLHSQQKTKASIARKLAALRTFFQFLVREGVI